MINREVLMCPCGRHGLFLRRVEGGAEFSKEFCSLPTALWMLRRMVKARHAEGGPVRSRARALEAQLRSMERLGQEHDDRRLVITAFTPWAMTNLGVTADAIAEYLVRYRKLAPQAAFTLFYAATTRVQGAAWDDVPCNLDRAMASVNV